MQSRPIATVVIPTHDHGPTLRWSVRSALAQTVTDLEVFIIGDGVPESGRRVIEELCAGDDRVRFFDHPKAGSRGETLRHQALAEARGTIVCYLSDDDLWLNDHVETIKSLLSTADFVSGFPVFRDTDGSLGGWIVDLCVPFYRQRILAGDNRIPLSCGAHTMTLYRRLPYGWRQTPPGTHTDLYMWQQILAMPELNTMTARQPTAMVFPSRTRFHLSPEQRAAELEGWWITMQKPDFRERLLSEVHSWNSRECVRLEVTGFRAAADAGVLSSLLQAERELVNDLKKQLNEGAGYADFLEREIAARGAYRQLLAGEIAARDDRIAGLAVELEQIRRSALWRAKNRLSGSWAAALGVRAARLLAGPDRRHGD
ncbi:MAG: glycosyltransferase family A protein [Acidobacteriota bacterium]